MYTSYFYRKVTVKISIPPPQEDSSIGGWRIAPTTLLKLQKKLGKLYWRQCLLMEKHS